ncbi:MAG: HAMP domain-containing sensor histidine kinase [Candidatus Krumholzibacteriia bacterium]
MPTHLARLFGRGRPRKGDDQAYGLRLTAALLEGPRPQRALEAGCRLALRTDVCDVAVVVERRREGGRLVVEHVAGRARRHEWRDLQEALVSRQSPLHDLGPDQRWWRLGDDAFQPGAPLLRRLDLRWLQALPLTLHDAERSRDALVLLAGRADAVDERHTLVRLARLIWLICCERLGAANAAVVAPPPPVGFEAGRWDRAPAALALVSPRAVLAVNDRARALLEDNVGRDGAAWESWLLGAVQRLDLAGLTNDTVVASRGRRRSLDITLGEADQPGQPRLVALAATAPSARSDVTDQEAALRTLGHELRTPLTAMKTSLGLVLRGDTGPLTEPQRKFLGATERNLDRLNRLLSDMLDAQRAEAGRLAVHTAAVDLAEILHQDLMLFEVTAREKGVRLVAADVPTSFRACVDADKLQQMLHNVLSNAVKYTPRGGVVRVALLERPDRAPGLCPRLAQRFGLACDVFTILVEDSGMGMSEDYLQRLFEPFSRDQRAEQSLLPGAGLGLHITRGLAEAHGGEVRLSSHPGRGTSVWLVLPRDPAGGQLVTVGRQLAAALDGPDAPVPVSLDLRHLITTSHSWELEAAGAQARAFLEQLARRTGPIRGVRAVSWPLAAGLWLGLVRDPARLDAAWQVATAAPESSSLLAGSRWQILDLGEGAASPATETESETETTVHTPAS